MKITTQSHNNSEFVKDMLDWYSLNFRELPWRKTKDPYKIWLSEIILQQTRVAQGLPYYEKFAAYYPNVQDFAIAKETSILKLWQGLGYYSRARNMHACAKDIVANYSCQFPSTYTDLMKLKGIGKYTAAAIASICFDEKVPTIDGNVFRVLSRLYGIYHDISQPATFKVFFETGKSIMPDQNTGMFNQAAMELGAMICKPKKPDCPSCPVREYCFAFEHKKQSELPVKTKKLKIRQRFLNYLVIQSQDQLLLRIRPEGDIWTGLHEFVLIEHEKEENDLQLLLRKTDIKLERHLYSSQKMVHQLTHQKLHIRFHVCQVNDNELNRLKKKLEMQAIDPSEINSFAVPKPIELFLKNEYLLLT